MAHMSRILDKHQVSFLAPNPPCFYLHFTHINDEDRNIDGMSEDFEEEIYLGHEVLAFLNVDKKKFLFIYQTELQKRLLNLYGQEIVLMEATYRTTKYTLPLYFIVVPTNVNYITVATFVTETENRQSIEEVLRILREWNPEWKPKYFMCDYATEGINAIETVFPESFVYLCDFHREQAWERWLTASHHGVQVCKSKVIGLMRKVAHSNTQEELPNNIGILKDKQIWKDHKNLRDRFERHWLSKAQRWVRAYRHERFNANINTNNGIERQNLALKYQYLQSKKASSLSHLLQVIVESFNFDSYRTTFFNRHH